MDEMKKGIKRSREGWFKKMVHLFDRATIEKGLWEELEELLISADVGVSTASRLIEMVSLRVESDRIGDASQARSALKDEMVHMLRLDDSACRDANQPIALAPSGPTVILVVGANGVGKTLSIAKLAHFYRRQGMRVLMAARYFTEAVEVTGVFLSKLDGTAKGGIVLAICNELRIPILFIGTGEAVDDLAPFDAETFVEALFS